MRTRRFGRTNWQVSEVGFGMWGMGDWTGRDDDESRRSLNRSVELGCNFYDTAWAYGNGRSERLLGELVRAHPDTRLYTATKIPPKNRKWPARPEYSLDETYPPYHIREYVEKSLKNLGLSGIDLIQFHVWDDGWADDERWQRAIDDLKSQGLIRAFGLSLNRWEPENGIKAIRTGLVDAVQVIYNIFDQAPEDALFPLCQKLDIGVIARVPLDEGSLGGKMTPDTKFPASDWRSKYFGPENLSQTLARVEELKKALPASLSLPDAALRFILANPTVSTTIVGMRKLDHVRRNIATSDAGPLDGDLLPALRKHRWDRKPQHWSD
jgi:aryl-alcohol dehydrogenase-like predicted oxidoreductase